MWICIRRFLYVPGNQHFEENGKSFEENETGRVRLFRIFGNKMIAT